MQKWKKKIKIRNSGISDLYSHCRYCKEHLKLEKAVKGNQTLDSFSNSKASSQGSANLRNNNTENKDIEPDRCENNNINIEIENLESNSSVKNSKPESSLSNFLCKEDVAKAEILFSMTQVYKKGSTRLFATLADLIPVMFPDSDITKKFKMQKDKVSYVITYGLGPFFQEELTQYVSKCKYYAISFDESLNKIAQKGQMDIVCRFWRDEHIETLYNINLFV